MLSLKGRTLVSTMKENHGPERSAESFRGFPCFILYFYD